MGLLCLDAGDADRAYTWYRRGHEAGLQEADIPRARKDLWEFRWAHARARVAARRGKTEEARKYVAAARMILDKGSNPEQQIYLPYLTGYVAFYTGDYAAALAELQSASQADPFIQCLMGQTYEKLGDRVKALEHTAGRLPRRRTAYRRRTRVRSRGEAGTVNLSVTGISMGPTVMNLACLLALLCLSGVADQETATRDAANAMQRASSSRRRECCGQSWKGGPAIRGS